MRVVATPTMIEQLAAQREEYRREMNCQIIHDSIHYRSNWSREFTLSVGSTVAGYGSVAIGGPWKGNPTIYEFYIRPEYRKRLFDCFDALLSASAAVAIEVQSNDPLLTVMLYANAGTIAPEAIVFHDRFTTELPSNGVRVRPAVTDDLPEIEKNRLDPEAEWVAELDGEIVAAGGILLHYNPSYGDIYMAVGEGFRRRGIGSYLVQELKRACCEQGKIPCARCNVANVASRKTLQRAGFVPCGAILHGTVGS
jgi:GNAT superfamily N-acetyltransferase